MNQHFYKIFIYTKGIYFQFKSIYQELPRNKQIAVLVFFACCVFGLMYVVIRGNKSEDTSTQALKVVTLRRVSDIVNKESVIPLLGIVTSTSEATIRAESGGKLTTVYKKLGDYVYAGEIIAQFENSAERAQTQQADGAYESAKASRDISKINNNTTNSSLVEAKNTALSALSNAYSAMDEAVRTKTDLFYDSPRTGTVKLKLSVPDSRLVYSLESSRATIEKILTARDERNRTLVPTDNLVDELNAVRSEAELVKTYLDDLSNAYTKAVPDSTYSQATIDNGKVSLGVARSSVQGTIATLTATRNSLIASTNAGEISSDGGDGVSIRQADAQVKQALGAYNASLSRLEKTIIRSPINGTLNSLSIETGDFISQFTEVGVVSNNGALEVVTYINEEDVKRIAVGGKVTMSPNIDGVITRIAGGIDPKTKKIEVRIGIISGGSSLINGQSIQVKVSRAHVDENKISGPITIPLSALKITPNGAYVYTTSTSSTLIAIPVTLGAILGDEMEITSGLTPSLTIVLDARGLKEGQKVTTQE